MSRKAPDPEPPANHERWIVTYADMLTLLFALFVVLWSMSDVDQSKLEKVRTSLDQAFSTGVLRGASGNSPIFSAESSFGPELHAERGQALAAIKERFSEFSDGTGIGPPDIQIRTLDGDSLTISLANNLLFGSGSASFEPGSQEVLKQVAAALLELSDSAEIRIVGHTDDVPPFGTQYVDNLELSAARALGVARFLADIGGVDPARLEVVGRGEYVPVASNETPEGRALNRRVDIEILFHEPVTDADLKAIGVIEADPEATASQTPDSAEAE